MKQRIVPLGYALSGGNITINEAEADTVREIAEQYLSGKSLKAIAEMLTAKHIEYMSGKTDWNRSRIKRIVEDKRYIGDGGYMPILTEQEYAAMQSIKAEKNTQKDVNHTEGIFTLNAPVVCYNCGGRMHRRYDKRRKAKEIPTPAGCSVWRQETIRSILSNEKYKGDAIINKTYVSDCISKRIKANNGERNKYYIENNHPAIIDAGTFARVQEEIARRSGKPKVKQKGTKTELSRYSSRYALSELLICGECRTPYRRCTWTAKGKRKIVWRCINRLDYGKKYCHHSPSIEENLLQDAVMRAIMQTAKQNVEVLKTLKIHIGMGLTDEVTEDKTLDIQIRIAEINAEFQKMLKAVSANNADGIDEEHITELMNEKQRLTVQLEQYAAMRQKRESAKSRLDEIYTILDGLQNHPMEYDDKLVRQIIECVVVESKEKIKVVFIGGTEIEMTL